MLGTQEQLCKWNNITQFFSALVARILSTGTGPGMLGALFPSEADIV